MTISIQLIKGIGPSAAEHLAKSGLTSAEDVARASSDQLLAVPGFGPARVKQIMGEALALVSAAERGSGKAKPDNVNAASTGRDGKEGKPKKKSSKKGKKAKKGKKGKKSSKSDKRKKKGKKKNKGSKKGKGKK